MITWLGFISELTTFMIEKVDQTVPEISPAQKKQIARKSYHYYEAIEDLETLAGKFLRLLAPVVDGEKSRIYRNWINGLDGEAELISEKYISGFDHLRLVLSYYQPDLYLMLSQFRSLKELRIAYVRLTGTNAFDHMRCSLRFEDSTFRGIDYTFPKDELLKVDFPKLMENTAGIEADRLKDLRYMQYLQRNHPLFMNKHGRSYDALGDLVAVGYLEDFIRPDEVDKVKQLHRVISKEQERFSTSKRKWAAFIKGHFTMEDMLSSG